MYLQLEFRRLGSRGGGGGVGVKYRICLCLAIDIFWNQSFSVIFISCFQCLQPVCNFFLVFTYS